MDETAVLNPEEFAPDAVEVALDQVGIDVRGEGIDWGESTIEAQMVRQAEGETSSDGHRPGVPIRIPLRAHEDGEVSLAEAANLIDAAAAQIQRDGGWIRRDFDDLAGFSGSIAYQIIPHTLTLSGLQGWLFGHRRDAPDVILTATRQPIGYATVEVESATFAEESARELIFELSDLLGTAPGLLRLRVTNKNASDHLRGMIYALECEDHPQDGTADTTAALAYSPTDLSLRGGSVDAGGGVLENSSLTAGWVTILASGLRPVVRAVGTVASGEGAITPGLPAGTVAGDLLIMVAENGGAAASGEASPKISASGWTELTTQTKGNSRLTILYKIAVGSDARTTNDTGDHQLARIIGVKKGSFDPASPFNVTGGGTRSATKSISITGAKTTRDDCLVIAAASGSLPDATGTSEFGAATNASLTNLTELIDNTVTAGDGGAIYAVAGYKTSKGAYSATTLEAATAADGGVISLAINPPASRHMTHKGVRRLWIRAEDTGENAGDVEYQLRWRSLGSSVWSEGPIVPSPLVDAYQLLDMGECRPGRAVIGEERWEWELQARTPSGSGKCRVSKVYPLPTEALTLVRSSNVTSGADLSSQKSPGTVADVAGFGTLTWSNPSNAKASDNSYATAESNEENKATHYLSFTNFGFAIPESATIVGVVFEVERKADDAKALNFCRDASVRMIIGGAIQSASDYYAPDMWPTTDTIKAYGSADDTWELSLTPAVVNASNFGFALAAYVHRAGGSSTVASVDMGRATVYYTEAEDPDRVCFATRSIELRSDGVFRQHQGDDVWGRLVPDGFLPFAPPPGPEGRKARAILIPTQGDFDTIADSGGPNKLSVVAALRPGYLFAREAG